MELGNDGMRHAIQNDWEGVTWLPSYIVRMYEFTINKSQTKQVLSMSILPYMEDQFRLPDLVVLR